MTTTAPWRAVVVPVVALLMFGAYVVTGAVEGGILRLPLQDRVSDVTSTLFPQGWAFFTKPADSEMLVPYTWHDEGLTSAAVGPNGEPRFAFGLDRTSRVQAAEVSLLLEGRGKDAWTACEGLTQAECLDLWDAEVYPVTNRMPDPTICGRTALFAETATPFEWRSQERRSRIPTQVTVLDVICPGERR